MVQGLSVSRFIKNLYRPWCTKISHDLYCLLSVIHRHRAGKQGREMPQWSTYVSFCMTGPSNHIQRKCIPHTGWAPRQVWMIHLLWTFGQMFRVQANEYVPFHVTSSAQHCVNRGKQNGTFWPKEYLVPSIVVVEVEAKMNSFQYFNVHISLYRESDFRPRFSSVLLTPVSKAVVVVQCVSWSVRQTSALV